MIQIGLILGIFLMSVFSTRADIVKTETLTKGEKTVYLLHDTHVSTPNAKLQAAAIDQALKETPDVKFLIQQVEPITETDKKFSSCVDSFKGFVEKRIFSDTLPEEHDNDDKQYGIAPCLDSADPKKIYINQLENWISTSWNFHINEESLAEIVKNIDIKNVTNEQWQTLVTNASLESFYYQYETWSDYLENLNKLIKSEKNKVWTNELAQIVFNKKKQLKTSIKNDVKYIKQLHAIKTHEESSKLKFVYPKISDLFLINKEIAHLKHNGILMVGINGGTEAVALSNILDDTGVKNIVLLANNSTCRNLKDFLILEGFSVENVTGDCLLSFQKVFFENQRKDQPLASSGAFKSSISGKTFKPIMIKITEIETLLAKDCTPFKLKLINNLT